MARVGGHEDHAGTRVTRPTPIRLNGRIPGALAMAAVTAAIVIASGTLFVARGQDASSLPTFAPSLFASAAPDPAVSAPPSPLASASPDPATVGSVDSPRTVLVEAGDLWFSPNEITIAAGEPTLLVLSDVGQVAHNLIVDELGLQLYVGPGISSEISVSQLPPGSYQFYCSIFGHRRAGMYGTLTIE